MGFESSRAFAIEIFQSTDTIEQCRILWEDFVEKTRKFHEEDKELIKEFYFFSNSLQPFSQSILRLYLQRYSGSGWLESYNQIFIPDYLALVEYVREKLEEVLES